jgi:Lon protease-like protein
MNEDLAALEQFDGIGRLFPLPNVVLFPQAMQVLHVFEPRYRQMMADALAQDRLIAMALLQPGWEADYEGNPPLYPVVCLGRILAEQQLDDGRYNILLRGLSRARIIQEVKKDRLYRSAQLQLLHDIVPPKPDLDEEIRRQIRKLVLPWFPADPSAVEQLNKLLHSDLTVGGLCDILSFALPFPIEVKQELLEELDVLRRSRLLLGHLKIKHPPKAEPQRKFPPDFSRN